MTPDLGYLDLDPATLKRAEEATEADRHSCVVRRASVEPASARVRRLRGLARDVIAGIRETA